MLNRPDTLNRQEKASARPIVEEVDRLQRLAIFEAAARLGSFTGAGAELGMTQPAVTRQIRLLERSLGVELFTRSANRSELTDTGRRFFDRVSAGFDVIEAGLGELADHAGIFVLAVHPGIAQMWIMPRIDELKQTLGDLDLRLWLFDSDAELNEGPFDAAIRVGSGKFSGLDSELLFPEVVVPIAAPGLAEEYGLSEQSTAHDVYSAPFVHLDDGERPWMSWSDWLTNFGIALQRQPGRVLFHNYPMVLQRALLGYGVALGWRPLIDEYAERGALVIVGPEVKSPQGYYVTWPSGPPSVAVQALIDWLNDSS
ncbi:MAG: LysR substrate-binding domain-containing protein [Acidimicrobiales bacterium]